MLYDGKQRADIVQFFAKTYGTKERTVDNYIKDARPGHQARLQADENIRARVQAEQTEEIAKELGMSRKYLLKKLKNVIDLDVRKLFTDDGRMKKPSEWDDDTAQAIGGVEIFEERTVNGKIGTSKKVKADPRITAITEAAKLLGYNPQATAKVVVDDPAAKGQPAKKISVTLNLT